MEKPLLPPVCLPHNLHEKRRESGRGVLAPFPPQRSP